MLLRMKNTLAHEFLNLDRAFLRRSCGMRRAPRFRTICRLLGAATLNFGLCELP